MHMHIHMYMCACCMHNCTCMYFTQHASRQQVVPVGLSRECHRAEGLAYIIIRVLGYCVHEAECVCKSFESVVGV